MLIDVEAKTEEMMIMVEVEKMAWEKRRDVRPNYSVDKG